MEELDFRFYNAVMRPKDVKGSIFRTIKLIIFGDLMFENLW